MKECLHENQSLIRLHHVSLFHFLEQVVGTCKIKIEKFFVFVLFYSQNVCSSFLYIYIYKSTTRTAFNLRKQKEKECEKKKN